MINLTQIRWVNGSRYELRQIYVNPEHIVALVDHILGSPVLNEANAPPGLDKRIQFTKMLIDKGKENFEIIVVGCPAMVEKKFTQRQLLKG